MALVPIEDTVVWFAHVADERFRERLTMLEAGEAIILVTDSVVGRWVRMESDKRGKKTPGIKPIGPMRAIWSEWFTSRKGEEIEVQEVRLAIDFPNDSTVLFPEWYSAGDEQAFENLGRELNGKF